MSNNVKVLRQKMDIASSCLQSARETVMARSTELKTAQQREIDLEEAQRLAQNVAQAIQQRAHEKIAGVVSRCLEAVFAGSAPYRFVVVFEQKRGRTQARLVFERDGIQVDPLTASGGGVVDVASFALRLSCLLLHKPPLRRLLILDEPFKYVSEEYRERVCEMLNQLSKEMDVQFLMVTHIDELKTGTIVELN